MIVKSLLTYIHMCAKPFSSFIWYVVITLPCVDSEVVKSKSERKQKRTFLSYVIGLVKYVKSVGYFFHDSKFHGNYNIFPCTDQDSFTFTFDFSTLH